MSIVGLSTYEKEKEIRRFFSSNYVCTYVYVFRTSGVKASDDTILTETDLAKSGNEAEKQEWSMTCLTTV